MKTKLVVLKFPTYLRKMWSGGEVQAWLNEHSLTDLELSEIERVSEEMMAAIRYWRQGYKTGEEKIVELEKEIDTLKTKMKEDLYD